MTTTTGLKREAELRLHRGVRRQRIFGELIGYLAFKAKTEGLKKAHIAARLGVDAAQITRWFSEPSNLTVDAISDLLTAMDADFDFEIVDARTGLAADGVEHRQRARSGRSAIRTEASKRDGTANTRSPGSRARRRGRGE